MPAHPGRSAPAEPGTSSGSWPHATPPARRAWGEIRAPDTLVDVTSGATADVGSIPTVSTKPAISRGNAVSRGERSPVTELALLVLQDVRHGLSELLDVPIGVYVARR